MIPVIYENSRIVIHSYPLLLGMALGACYLVTQWLFHKKKTPLSLFYFIFWPSTFFAWVGAKLFFYWFSYNQEASILGSTSFWMGGGMVFYGAIVFIFLYLGVIVILKIISIKEISLFIPGLCLGHSIGRIGCLLTGCCYGTETSSFLSVSMHNAHRHPVQLYESLLLFTLFIFTLRIVLRDEAFKAIVFYFISYSFIRFFLEFLRGDKIRGIWGPFSTSQYISLSLGLSIFLIFILHKINFSKKGS